MDQAPKRKHRANGKPNGGKREGAGRPPGSTNKLRLGEVKAIAAMKLRMPEGADPAIQTAAARAFERLVEVMEEEVHYMDAGNVLKAATRIREEACGPLAQKLEHTGANGEPLGFQIVYRGEKK